MCYMMYLAVWLYLASVLQAHECNEDGDLHNHGRDNSIAY